MELRHIVVTLLHSHAYELAKSVIAPLAGQVSNSKYLVDMMEDVLVDEEGGHRCFLPIPIDEDIIRLGASGEPVGDLMQESMGLS